MIFWNKEFKNTEMQQPSSLKYLLEYLTILYQNGERAKAGALLQKAENYASLKQMVVDGKKIDILKIEPINPSLILGYDEHTRLESNSVFKK